MLSNGPEYEARLKRDFSPPQVSLKDVHDAVPKHLLMREPITSAYYIARDIAMAIAFFKAATVIEPFANYVVRVEWFSEWQARILGWLLWSVYWWFQGLVWAGIFCLGHDAGHGTLFSSSITNNCVGFALHTFLLIPYFSWRATHHAHHKATGSIERDENYVPHTRSDLDLPPARAAKPADYAEIFEETPLWTLIRVLIMQGFGWWLYLTCNTLGSKMYPKGTNHFSPSSPLFKKEQRHLIALSDIGLTFMAALLIYVSYRFGLASLVSYYMIPYLLTNHWIVMFTYLHHSDPTIPHYRKEEWTFLRGAVATVDRPLMGWMGRFFLHNISHDHIAHHLFVSAPFYNGPEITRALRVVLKDDYNYDSTNTFYALWRSFTQCLFIEEDAPIAFYKNKFGEAARRVKQQDTDTPPGRTAETLDDDSFNTLSLGEASDGALATICTEL